MRPRFCSCFRFFTRLFMHEKERKSHSKENRRTPKKKCENTNTIKFFLSKESSFLLVLIAFLHFLFLISSLFKFIFRFFKRLSRSTPNSCQQGLFFFFSSS